MAGLMVAAVGVGALTLNAVNSASNPQLAAETLADAAAPTLVSSYPADGTTVPMWSFTKLLRFRFSGDIQILRDGAANIQIAVPKAFGGGFTVLETIPVSNDSKIYLNPENSSELWVNTSDFEYVDAKNYSIILEEGLISVGGEQNAEASITFSLLNTPEFTTIPGSGTTLTLASQLENITVKFDGTGYTNIDFAEPNATMRPKVNLFKIDGNSRTRVGSYNTTINGFDLELKYSGEMPELENAPVSYEVVVPSGYVFFNNEDGFAGGSATITISDLKLQQSTVEWGEITDCIQLSTPSSLEVTPANSTSSFGSTGLGIISFIVNTENFFGLANSEPITMTYAAEEGGASEVLASFESTDSSKIMFMGRGAAADEFSSSYFMYLFLAGDEEGEFNQETLEKFKRDGYYTLTIPDGAFMSNDKMLKGTTMVFHYSSDATADLEYDLTPVSGSELKKAAEVFGPNGSGIVLKFKNSSFLDYKSKPGTLTLPDNTVLNRAAPETNQRDEITWRFGTATTDWPAGTYTFTIPKGKIGVDMGWEDDWDEGNFEGLTAVYTVTESEYVGVVMIGAEKADNYTVYTLGGALVKENVSAGALVDLEPGLYIVNGKKTIVRK